MKTKKTVLLAAVLSALSLSFAMFATSLHGRQPTEEEQAAMEVLPGYSVVYNGKTNILVHSDSVRIFRNQHPMMEYLQMLVPHIKHYSYRKPKYRQINIHETEDRVILEIPSWYKLEPGHEIIWGSGYRIKMEIDKKTKQIVDAVQG